MVFEIARTAVLAMDCQTGIVSIYAKPQDEFLARAATVLRTAREATITVVHVRVGFRSGLPELVLLGIATSGVVLSTLLHACDADYQLFVISDCCADLDAELHDVLLTRLFPQRATVLTALEFVEAVRGGHAHA